MISLCFGNFTANNMTEIALMLPKQKFGLFGHKNLFWSQWHHTNQLITSENLGKSA